MISVIILTYNDEVQIRNTLESVAGFSDDIIIVDSNSVDKTRDICSLYTDKFYTHDFINQAKQFNWCIENIPIKNSWVLRLDSDEVLLPKLKNEIIEKLSGNYDYDAYYMNRQMYWMGRRLKYGGLSPHYIVRLFKRGRAKYEERTEEHLVVDGKLGYLQSHFYENNLKNTIRYFTEKHMYTAEGEILELLMEDTASLSTSTLSANVFGPKISRTRWLKLNVYNKIPLFARPFAYFFYRYFIRFGFLDGKEGLVFHVLQAFWYRFYIDSRLYELSKAQPKVHSID